MPCLHVIIEYWLVVKENVNEFISMAKELGWEVVDSEVGKVEDTWAVGSIKGKDGKIGPGTIGSDMTCEIKDEIEISGEEIKYDRDELEGLEEWIEELEWKRDARLDLANVVGYREAHGWIIGRTIITYLEKKRSIIGFISKWKLCFMKSNTSIKVEFTSWTKTFITLMHFYILRRHKPWSKLEIVLIIKQVLATSSCSLELR